MMNKKQQTSFANLVKKASSYKPKEAPKQPTKAPSVEELNKVYKLNPCTLTLE